MNGTKSALLSSTVWGGGIAAILGGLAPWLVYVEVLKEGLPPLISQGAALFGGILAVWGRVKATKKIS